MTEEINTGYQYIQCSSLISIQYTDYEKKKEILFQVEHVSWSWKFSTCPFFLYLCKYKMVSSSPQNLTFISKEGLETEDSSQPCREERGNTSYVEHVPATKLKAPICSRKTIRDVSKRNNESPYISRISRNESSYISSYISEECLPRSPQKFMYHLNKSTVT